MDNIEVKLSIIAGHPSAAHAVRAGARRWWVQGARSGWVDTERCPGTEPAELTARLSPGERVLVGTGEARIRFACPQRPCTVQIDPLAGTARVIEDRPAPAAPAELWVVEGHPTTAGLVYGSGAAAWAALERIPAAERVGCVARRATLATVAVAPADAAGWDAHLAALEHRDALPVEPTEDTEDPVSGPPATPAGPPVRELAPPPRVAEIQSPRREVAIVEVVPEPVAPPVHVPRTVDAVEAGADSLAAIGIARPPAARYLGAGGTHQLGGVAAERAGTNLARAVAISHGAWEKQPITVSALRDTILTVRGEVRTDIPIPDVSELRMDERGALHHAQWNVACRPEPRALRELVTEHASVLPRAGQLMAMLPPDVRAQVWNAQVPYGRSAPGVLRTRLGPDGKARQIYALVSPGYQSFDADDIAGMLSEAIAGTPGGSEARGEVWYDPDSTELVVDASWHTPHTVSAAVGDTFRFGVQCRGNDAGNGAIYLVPRAWRGACDNGATVSVEGTTTRVVHRGRRDTMVGTLRRGIRAALEAAQPFLEQWTAARTVPVTRLLDRAPADEREAVRCAIDRVLGVVPAQPDEPTLRGAWEIKVDGLPVDALRASVWRAWEAEPDPSAIGIINALTRLHRERVPVPVLRQVEDRAGELLRTFAALA